MIQQIFDSFYKSIKLRLDVRDLRFLRPDVAVVHFDGRVVGPGEQLPEQPQFVLVAVMTKEDGLWRAWRYSITRRAQWLSTLARGMSGSDRPRHPPVQALLAFPRGCGE